MDCMWYMSYITFLKSGFWNTVALGVSDEGVWTEILDEGKHWFHLLSNLLSVDFLCFKIKVGYSDFKSEYKITGIRYILFWGY